MWILVAYFIINFIALFLSPLFIEKLTDDIYLNDFQVKHVIIGVALLPCLFVLLIALFIAMLISIIVKTLSPILNKKIFKINDK